MIEIGNGNVISFSVIMAQGISTDIGSTSRGGAAIVGLSVVAGLGHNFVFRLVGLVRKGGRRYRR